MEPPKTHPAPPVDDMAPAAEAYRHWAEIYDSHENRTRDLDARCLIAADLPLAGAHVVEFGAGTGKNTAHLASRAARVLALDLSPAMLAKARARVPADHARFIEHDIQTPWPVETGSADLVVGNLVLEHVAELAPVLTEAARALRPGGQLYLSELHPFRQLQGSQARYEDVSGRTVRVEAYYHGVADYLAAARAAGLTLLELQEGIEDGIEISAGTPPRLLILRFVRSA